MNILQSALIYVWTFGAMLQQLVNPVPPANVSLTTDISAGNAEPVLLQTLGNLDDYLLPDMLASAPKQMYIVSSGGTRTLRFSTTFANIGDGPLELVGKAEPARDVTVASQNIKKKDGGEETRVVGEFVYHPTHKHWHVEKYSLFQLWQYEPGRGPTELVASTDKMSFCIWDEHTYDTSLPNAPKTRQYPRCITSMQGNSVGWGDTYTANTDGQEIDITGLPDGRYMTRSIVNAESQLLEKDYINNEAISYVEIAGNSIKVIDP